MHKLVYMNISYHFYFIDKMEHDLLITVQNFIPFQCFFHCILFHIWIISFISTASNYNLSLSLIELKNIKN